MTSLLHMPIWKTPPLRHSIMKFVLTYEGDLPASGNKPKPSAVWDIRAAIAPQIEELLKTHPTLVEMAKEGVLSEFFPPIRVRGNDFVPIVRHGLRTMCRLDILFLRKGEPPGKVYQGGDIDNRIKTLFDGLRMPTKGDPLPPEGANRAWPMRTLLENDDLITGFSVRSERLLSTAPASKHWVSLVIDVDIRISSVTHGNAAFLGD